MSEAISDPGIHRPGRHRRGAGANTWTPAVPSRRGSARHGSPIETASTAPLIPTQTDTEARYAHYLRQRTRAHARRGASPAAMTSAATASFPPQRTAAASTTASTATGTATRTATATRTTATLSGVLPLDELAQEPDAWEAAYGFSASSQPAYALPATPDTAASVAPEAPEAPEAQGDTEATPDADVALTALEPPAEDQPLADPDALAASAGERPGENTIRRTRVTLTPTEPRRSEPRIYYAPPKDGLSTFDLGTVPASVTPPRSWRKAAWFATVSSGGVVVALLVAASYVVGQQPPQDQVAIENWTGLRGENPPPLHEEGFAAPQERTTTTTAPGSSSNVIADRAAVLPSTSMVLPSQAPQPTTAPDATGAPSPTTSAAPSSSAPTTTAEPQKPPPSPAERETRSDYFYRFPPDAETMGDRSEIFLNQITENPEKAHEQTGGDLYAEGADAIAARYSHIAYFEIEHIYIDQRNRVTVNTVKVVFEDGTTERQQRTLRFEEGDKITDD